MRQTGNNAPTDYEYVARFGTNVDDADIVTLSRYRGATTSETRRLRRTFKSFENVGHHTLIGELAASVGTGSGCGQYSLQSRAD